MRLNAPARKTSAGLITALLMVTPLLGGCGGAGHLGTQPNGPGSSQVGDTRAKGTATVTVTWPDRSRLIPISAESIKITLTRTPATVQPVAPQVLTRPVANPNLQSPTQPPPPLTSTATFSNLEIGDYTVTASAYPNPDGTGTAQATATVTVTVKGGQNSPLGVTMGTTIVNLVVSSSNGTRTRAGEVLQFNATGVDANNNIVLLQSPINPGANSQVWSVTDTSGNPTALATIDPKTGALTVSSTPVTSTQTIRVTVKDTDTGKTASIDIQILQVGLANTQWPKFHGNAQNSGLALSGASTTGSQLWQYTTQGAIEFSSPAIIPTANGPIAYVGAQDGNMYALQQNGANPSQVTKLWTFKTGGFINSSPAVSVDGTVYFGSEDGKVYAVNGTTGALLWQQATGGPVDGSPAIGPDGNVYIGSLDGNLYALHPFTGKIIWRFAAADGIRTAPALSIDGSVVYVGSLDSNLYAVNAASGALIWRFQTGDQIFSSGAAVAPNGNIYFGSFDGKLYGLDSSGNKLAGSWPYDSGAPIYSSPAIGADGTVYFGTFNNGSVGTDRVIAVNGATGVEKWQHPVGAGITSSPAVGSDGTVYIGCYDGNLYALNSAASGAVKWTFFTGDNIDSSPAISSDGTIYIGGYNSRVYAIR